MRPFVIDYNSAHILEQNTTQQVECPLWHNAWRVRITASNFAAFVTRKKANVTALLNTLLNKKIVPNVAMQWG